MVGGGNKPVLKLRDMEEKHLHNLFLKNMSGLIEEVKNPTPRLNPNSKCGGMATHAGLALELGITMLLEDEFGEEESLSEAGVASDPVDVVFVELVPLLLSHQLQYLTIY